MKTGCESPTAVIEDYVHIPTVVLGISPLDSSGQSCCLLVITLRYSDIFAFDWELQEEEAEDTYIPCGLAVVLVICKRPHIDGLAKNHA